MIRRDAIKAVATAIGSLALPASAIAADRWRSGSVLAVVDPGLPESRQLAYGANATYSLTGNPWFDWHGIISLSEGRQPRICGVVKAHDAEFFRAVAREHRMQLTCWDIVAHKPGGGQSLVRFALEPRGSGSSPR